MLEPPREAKPSRTHALSSPRTEGEAKTEEPITITLVHVSGQRHAESKAACPRRPRPLDACRTASYSHAHSRRRLSMHARTVPRSARPELTPSPGALGRAAASGGPRGETRRLLKIWTGPRRPHPHFDAWAMGAVMQEPVETRAYLGPVERLEALFSLGGRRRARRRPRIPARGSGGRATHEEPFRLEIS